MGTYHAAGFHCRSGGQEMQDILLSCTHTTPEDVAKTGVTNTTKTVDNTPENRRKVNKVGNGTFKTFYITHNFLPC